MKSSMEIIRLTIRHFLLNVDVFLAENLRIKIGRDCNKRLSAGLERTLTSVKVNSILFLIVLYSVPGLFRLEGLSACCGDYIKNE